MAPLRSLTTELPRERARLRRGKHRFGFPDGVWMGHCPGDVDCVLEVSSHEQFAMLVKQVEGTLH